MMGPKSVPTPGSAAVIEALNLLVMMGSNNKAGAKLLHEMKSVQECNEKLLVEVKDDINKLSRAQAKLDKSQQKLESDTKTAQTSLARQKQGLYQQDADMKTKTKAFDLVTKARLEDYDRKTSELNAREALVTKREAAGEALEYQLNVREERADKRDTANEALLDDLNERDDRLRKAMGG